MAIDVRLLDENNNEVDLNPDDDDDGSVVHPTLPKEELVNDMEEENTDEIEEEEAE